MTPGKWLEWKKNLDPKEAYSSQSLGSEYHGEGRSSEEVSSPQLLWGHTVILAQVALTLHMKSPYPKPFLMAVIVVYKLCQ